MSMLSQDAYLDTDTDTSLLNPTRRPKEYVVRVSTFRVRSQGEMVGALGAGLYMVERGSG